MVGVAIDVSLTLCEGREYEGRRIVLFRRVSWPSVPPEGAWLTFGRMEDGEEASINATVTRVAWNASGASGAVEVMAEVQELRDEYDAIVAYARADGFKEYNEA